MGVMRPIEEKQKKKMLISEHQIRQSNRKCLVKPEYYSKKYSSSGSNRGTGQLRARRHE